MFRLLYYNQVNTMQILLEYFIKSKYQNLIDELAFPLDEILCCFEQQINDRESMRIGHCKLRGVNTWRSLLICFIYHGFYDHRTRQ